MRVWSPKTMSYSDINFSIRCFTVGPLKDGRNAVLVKIAGQVSKVEQHGRREVC